jgi:hypothetical protein
VFHLLLPPSCFLRCRQKKPSSSLPPIDYIIDNHPSTTTFPARAVERECFLKMHS